MLCPIHSPNLPPISKQLTRTKSARKDTEFAMNRIDRSKIALFSTLILCWICSFQVFIKICNCRSFWGLDFVSGVVCMNRKAPALVFCVVLGTLTHSAWLRVLLQSVFNAAFRVRCQERNSAFVHLLFSSSGTAFISVKRAPFQACYWRKMSIIHTLGLQCELKELENSQDF